MRDDLDLTGVRDAEAQRIIDVLLTMVEELAGQVEDLAGQVTALQGSVEDLAGQVGVLKEEKQALRDEVARLQGEQGKPRFLPNKRPVADHSSEAERREPRAGWHKGPKQSRLVISRTQEQRVERGSLPADAVFKGYAEVVVQEVVVRPDIIRFRLERWYSPGQHRVYQAPLPPGYHGQFGPGFKALLLYLTYETNVSQAKLRALVTSVGLSISAGELSALLTQQPGLTAEYQAIGQAGLASTPAQHIDETPTRVKGVTAHCHILATSDYTRYHTTPGLDRQAVLDVLRLGAPRRFCLNAAAWAFLDGGSVPAKTRHALHALPQDVFWDEPTFLALVEPLVPATHPALRRFILEGAGIGAYRAQTDVPVVQTLIADGAYVWQALTEQLAWCWVHEGRHYKKLCPALAVHRHLLDTTLRDFWIYYHQVRAYQSHPTPQEALRLDTAFDTLFSQTTGYAALDACLQRTLQRKARLLLALAHPELPLHNNPAELAARRRVRKRDASFGARSAAGLHAWDVFHTLLDTAHKLGVNSLHYLQDRLSESCSLPSLASCIPQHSHATALP